MNDLRIPLRNHGFALVVVLMVLALCVVLVISLTTRGKVSLQSSTAYQHTSQVRALSEMTVALVQAQIRDATTDHQLPETALDERHSWASQPGAIRVFSPYGDLARLYKLYSARQMVQNDSDLSNDIPANWHTLKSEFTDLNEPVQGLSGLHYPILHPGTSDLMTGATGIANGFEIRADAPLEPISPGRDRNLAPMPIRWIYVLEDGTHCELGDSRIDATTNPIIGRIAFWTDDETAKVNLNTAAPVVTASHWDVPRANSTAEYNTLSLFQPSQNEYQRYPGHPAMVSLVSILGNLGNLSKSAYYGLTPSYRWGGSEDGARSLRTTRTDLLTHKEDRLYATVDELLFQGPDAERNTPISATQLEALRFFLTTSSRSPELNLFGQPRVSLWPIFGNPDSADPGDTRRTFYDRLSINAATVAGKPYYFTREDPLSPIHDYEEIPRNRALYAYLQRLTQIPIPGFGPKSFLEKYGDDRDQLLTQMFDYIRSVNLNETYRGKHPDFESYTADWKIERLGGSASAINTGSDYFEGNKIQGAGFLTPIQINGTRGMGRFPVISEVGLMFVNHAKARPQTREDGTVVMPEPPHPQNPEQLEAMVVFETITPAFGYMPWCGTEFYFDVTACNIRFRVGTREMDLLPTSVIGQAPRPVHYPPLRNGGMSPGGYDGAAYSAGQGPHWMGGSGTGMSRYPFFSDPLDLEPSDTEFSLIGGSMTVQLRVKDQVVQTYQFDFPSITSLPRPIRSNLDISVGFAWTIGRPWWSTRGTHGPLDGDVLHALQVRHGDVRLVMGKQVVPASDFAVHADYGKPQRFAHSMATSTGNSPVLWNGGTIGKYVDLDLLDWRLMPASAAGEERTLRRRGNFQKVPAGITDLRSEGWSGDFDNGWTFFGDGPFINKADEGMLNRAASGILDWDNVPYATWTWHLGDGLFSPLRQIPSAVMFGSLPSGVNAGKPWQTLLFNPHPADPAHPGAANGPPDYLWLDLFRMPVCEPFSISGPASTDGKINLNYAIAPFDYVRRASAWYALLEPIKFFAIPDTESASYKGVWANSTAVTPTAVSRSFRYEVDPKETLRQFEERFSGNDIFRSAGEICTISLVPKGETVEDMAAFWAKHQLTGDNSREKPYAELYPKLTTQSNTYRIHFRAQLLPRSQGLPNGAADFKPLAEYRGSRLIERYLPADHPGLASPFDSDQQSLQSFYRYRTLENLQFAP